MAGFGDILFGSTVGFFITRLFITRLLIVDLITGTMSKLLSIHSTRLPSVRTVGQDHTCAIRNTDFAISYTGTNCCTDPIDAIVLATFSTSARSYNRSRISALTIPMVAITVGKIVAPMRAVSPFIS